jgi:shikimate dehydrogenase
MTSTIALIGHPVAHSISPRFQQAALDAMGVDARYEAWDVLPADLAIAVERLRSADLLGANVTVPHKVEIRRLVDRPDALVERVGAVNTIVRRDGMLHATNTDVAGVLRALEGADVELANQRVVLIGAGGAARAVVVAMRMAGVSALTVANRSRERADALVGLGGDELSVDVCPLDERDEGFREALSPVPASLFHVEQVAFDLVYVPERTPFLAAAERAGARTVGGLAMLVHQGAEAFRLWTGYEPPVDVMFAAARAALAS